VQQNVGDSLAFKNIADFALKILSLPILNAIVEKIFEHYECDKR